ncbi:MAG: hypothetical protein ABIP03_10815 [Aquihabitans sp.]
MVASHRRRSTLDRIGREHGTGLLGSAAGVAAFLLFLLFAVQLLVNLYATSVVTAAGLDAARSVASRSVNHGDPATVADARQRAEAGFRNLLGEASQDARLRWDGDGEFIRLHVLMETPGILPSALAGPVAFGTIDRTFVVRVEELR